MKAGCSDYPGALFDFAGYKLTIRAIARPAEQRNNTHFRAIGASAMASARFTQPSNGVRKAVKEKASRYGNLCAPFVIGLNIIDSCFWNDGDVEDALFGDDQIVDVRQPNGRWRSEIRRVPNGVFIRGHTPQNTRVSAVLAFRNLFPWSVSASKVRVFHNPWAKYPYSGVLDVVPAAREVNGVYLQSEGCSVSEVLNVPD